MPNLVPQTWRVPREPGSAGSDVSRESSHSRVNQLGLRQEGRLRAGMNDLPAAMTPLRELLPEGAAHTWAGLPTSIKGNQDN